jgi:hypothetical protein
MAVALLLWIFLQLLALSAGTLSVHAILVVQFIAAGMFFSYLLRDLRFAGMMILSAGALLALAANRARVPIGNCIVPWICLAIWVTVLTFAAKLPAKHHSTLIAIAMLLTAGGLVLWYVASEFGGNAAVARFSPLVLTLRLLG